MANNDQKTGSVWSVAQPSGSNYFAPAPKEHAPGLRSIESLIQRSRAYESDPVAYARFFSLNAQMNQEELPDLSVDQLRAEIRRQTASLRPGTLDWARYQIALQRIYKNTDLRDLDNSKFELRGPDDGYDDIDRDALAMLYTGGESPRPDPALIAANPAALLNFARPDRAFDWATLGALGTQPTDLPEAGGSVNVNGSPGGPTRSNASKPPSFAKPSARAASGVYQPMNEWRSTQNAHRVGQRDLANWIMDNPYARTGDTPLIYQIETRPNTQNAYDHYYSFTIAEVVGGVQAAQGSNGQVEQTAVLTNNSEISVKKAKIVRVNNRGEVVGQNQPGRWALQLEVGENAAPVLVDINDDYYNVYYKQPVSYYKDAPNVDQRVQVIPIVYHKGHENSPLNRLPNFDSDSPSQLVRAAADGYNHVIRSFMENLTPAERQTVRVKFAFYVVNIQKENGQSTPYITIAPYLSAMKNGKEQRAFFTVNIKNSANNHESRSFFYGYMIPVERLQQNQLIKRLHEIGKLWGFEQAPSAVSGWSDNKKFEMTRAWVDQFNNRPVDRSALPVFVQVDLNTEL